MEFDVIHFSWFCWYCYPVVGYFGVSYAAAVSRLACHLVLLEMLLIQCLLAFHLLPLYILYCAPYVCLSFGSAGDVCLSFVAALFLYMLRCHSFVPFVVIFAASPYIWFCWSLSPMVWLSWNFPCCCSLGCLSFGSAGDAPSFSCATHGA